MAEYDNNLRGVLFHNDKGDNPNRPDMTGSCEVDGVEYKISAWNKTSQKGSQFMSLSLQLKDAQPNGAAKPAPQQQATIDDDVPF
jgi:uncharacterized protein (DUF736 family)